MHNEVIIRIPRYFTAPALVLFTLASFAAGMVLGGAGPACAAYQGNGPLVQSKGGSATTSLATAMASANGAFTNAANVFAALQTVTRPHVDGAAEQLLKVGLDEDTDNYLVLGNASTANGIFVPGLLGYSDSTSKRGLVAEARTGADSGTTPMMQLDFASGSTPGLGQGSAIVNRVGARVSNDNVSVVDINPGGVAVTGTFSATSTIAGTVVTGSTRLVSGSAAVRNGSGTPEGSATGNVGDIYLRTGGGLYTKVSGTGTTGWSAVALGETLTTLTNLNFPDTASGSVSELTATLNGVVDGDEITVTPTVTAVPPAGHFWAYWSNTNTVTVRFENNSGSNQNPAQSDFRIVARHF